MPQICFVILLLESQSFLLVVVMKEAGRKVQRQATGGLITQSIHMHYAKERGTLKPESKHNLGGTV